MGWYYDGEDEYYVPDGTHNMVDQEAYDTYNSLGVPKASTSMRTAPAANKPSSWSELMAMASLPEVDREFGGGESVVRDIPGYGKVTFVPQTFGTSPWVGTYTDANGNRKNLSMNSQMDAGGPSLLDYEPQKSGSFLGGLWNGAIKPLLPIAAAVVGGNLAAGNFGSIGSATAGTAGAPVVDLSAAFNTIPTGSAIPPGLITEAMAGAPGLAGGIEGANFFEGMTPAETLTSQGFEALPRVTEGANFFEGMTPEETLTSQGFIPEGVEGANFFEGMTPEETLTSQGYPPAPGGLSTAAKLLSTAKLAAKLSPLLSLGGLTLSGNGGGGGGGGGNPNPRNSASLVGRGWRGASPQSTSRFKIPGYAEGGPLNEKRRAFFDHLRAGGTPRGGQADDVPAMLSVGEYVMDAATVADLGDGDNAEGARRLDEMRKAVRQHKRSGPLSKIPPKAKMPHKYLHKKV